jgi:hypothetical protein
MAQIWELIKWRGLWILFYSAETNTGMPLNLVIHSKGNGAWMVGLWSLIWYLIISSYWKVINFTLLHLQIKFRIQPGCLNLWFAVSCWPVALWPMLLRYLRQLQWSFWECDYVLHDLEGNSRRISTSIKGAVPWKQTEMLGRTEDTGMDPLMIIMPVIRLIVWLWIGSKCERHSRGCTTPMFALCHGLLTNVVGIISLIRRSGDLNIGHVSCSVMTWTKSWNIFRL